MFTVPVMMLTAIVYPARFRDSRMFVLVIRMDSDTVEAFLNEKTVKDPGSRTERGELYSAYKQYCLVSDRQALTRNNFYRSMRVKGYGESVYAGLRYLADLAVLQPGQKKELPEGYIEADVPPPF